MYLARTDEAEIQRQVLPALCTLSFHDSNKIPICRNGGLDTVVRFIRDSSAENARLACATIANLAEMAVNFDNISESTAIPNLVSTLQSPNEEVKRESARALGNLAANIELGDVILREGALPFLIPMLRSSDNLTQRMAGMALCSKCFLSFIFIIYVVAYIILIIYYCCNRFEFKHPQPVLHAGRGFIRAFNARDDPFPGPQEQSRPRVHSLLPAHPDQPGCEPSESADDYEIWIRYTCTVFEASRY